MPDIRAAIRAAGEMVRVLPHLRQRNLMGTVGALHRNAVNVGGAGPSLGGAQDDRGPVTHRLIGVLVLPDLCVRHVDRRFER